MLVDIVAVNPLSGTKVYLRFEDGKEGTVDIADIVEFTGVFESLKEPKFFRSVRVNPELGTICWPNGADLCPDVLYAKATNQAIPEFGSPKHKTG